MKRASGGGARPGPSPHRLHIRGRAPRVLGALMAVTVVSLAVAAACAGRAAAESSPAPLITPIPTNLAATVDVATSGRLRPVPRSFLGFSTEYYTLPVDELHPALYGRILSDLQVPGQRLVLRIGGDSADQSFWDPGVTSYPAWAFHVTPTWMRQTAALVAANHLHVILDVNYITGTPQLAAGLVSEAERVFPPGSIVGIEIGNEVDLYTLSGWQGIVGSSSVGPFNASRLPVAITPLSYASRYSAFARALSRAAPHVPLIAPALARPVQDVDWIRDLEHPPHPNLGEISVHQYPYGDCDNPSGASYPTVAKLLSAHAVDTMYSSIRPAVAQAHHAHLPLRLTEFNSVTCGGVDTVSDSFATALWAPGALFEMLSAGAAAANLHLRVTPINAPFVFEDNVVSVRPLLYGLILFQRMLGPDSRVADVHVRTAGGLGLTAWAVQVGSGKLNVLLLDKDRRGAHVTLRTPGGRRATVRTLTAPSATGAGDVTFGGRHLNGDARWQGPRRSASIHGTHGVFHVHVRGISAALVSIPDR